MIAKFLIKGLLRDRSRSLFPLIVVITGACLTVVAYSYLNGILDDIVGSAAKFNTGHVKIVTKAYSEASDQLPNDLALLNVTSIMEHIRSDNPKMIFMPRIKFAGLLDIPDKEGMTRAQGPVFGLAIDIRNKDSPEKRVFKIENALVDGRMPEEKNEILISDNFAQKLNVCINETATLLSTSMYGSMVIQDFIVVGLIQFGIVQMDKNTIIADLNDVQLALDMEDAASEIVGYTPNLVYNNNEMAYVARRFNQKYFKVDDDFSPIMKSMGEQEEMADIVNTALARVLFFIAIFLIAISIVLWNSGLINGIRRYREIGIRLAMGEPKTGVYRSMILESTAVGICGSFIGTILGLGIAYYLQEVGLDFSSATKNAPLLMSNIFRARVTNISFYIGFITGTFAPVLGTMLAGIGIYRRQTSYLLKEMEV